jgi:perosamine synthetase
MTATTSRAILETRLKAIAGAVRSVVGTSGNVALHEPEFGGSEWKYVKECLDSGWVSSVGKFVDRFEAELATFTGARHAIAVVNGTAALHLCLRLAGVDSGDEVLVPTLTFIATANAVSYCGAIPHFCDVDELTLGLDARKLESYLLEIADVRDGQCFNRKSGSRLRAVVPMHAFGHPVNMDALLEVANRFGLLVVEDAAESLGSQYRGQHTGVMGQLGALSFNGNKIITTGGGGAILTNDDSLARAAKHLSTTARVSHKWSFVHDAIGYNYRMPNVNAAIGVAQLEQLDGFVESKRALADAYRRAFDSMPGVSFFSEPPFSRSNYWLNSILVDHDRASDRDALLETLNDEGLMARPTWTLMHRLPMYRDCPRMDVSRAESIERRLVNLPSSARLGHQ